MGEAFSRVEMNGASGEQARAVSLADLVGELVMEAEEAWKAAAEGRARGPVTTLHELDRTIGGCLEPGLHVFTGDPGSGKTALAAQIAARCGCPALFVTAEQSPLVLFRRHIARETQTPLGELRKVAPKKVAELAQQAAAKSPMLTILDATQRPAEMKQIVALARAMKTRFEARHVLIAVDALQPWARGVYAGDEYSCIQAGLTDFVTAAHELHCPVLVLSHRNRVSTQGKSEQAGLVAAKGSADFEHLADTALHLSVQKAADPHAPGPVEITLNVAKNRQGPSGFGLALKFDGKVQTFTDGSEGRPRF